MKSYTLRFAAPNKDYFLALKSGEKRVETRAASTKYKNIAVGDSLTFVCGTQKFTRIVKSVTTFKTLSAMLKKYKVSDIVPWMKTQAELQATYDGYSGYIEKLKQFGFIAIEFK